MSAPELSAASRPAPSSSALGRIGAATLPLPYLLVVGICVVLAGGYSLRKDGIFACGRPGDDAGRYVSYCQALSYGDYDYGAFWFDLEPKATAAAAAADVLIIGNSRTQMGFSAAATDSAFDSLGARYYLLGFSHNGNVHFTAPLLRRLQPRARAYVLNLDLFFEPYETGPARTVMHDPGARTRYRQKRMWQPLHRVVCDHLSVLCGDEPAFLRTRTTGAWTQTGGHFTRTAVTYETTPDEKVVTAYVRGAEQFLSTLPVDRSCIILTVIPTVRTPRGSAEAIARALHLDLIAPEVDSLNTYDGSHLEAGSAEAWSEVFFRAAGPRLGQCLSGYRPTAAAAR